MPQDKKMSRILRIPYMQIRKAVLSKSITLLGIVCGIILTLTFQYLFLNAETVAPPPCPKSINFTEIIVQPAEKCNTSTNNSTYEEFINHRKILAEKFWNQSVTLRMKFEQNNTVPGFKGTPEIYGKRVLWDHWYPTFDCPYMLTRIGDIGDGGQWICGFEEIKKQDSCTVFSFSVGADTTFEETILRNTTNCKVYIFNPLFHQLQQTTKINKKYPNRIFFHKYELCGVEDPAQHHPGRVSPYEEISNSYTLKEIMEKLKIPFIDILTMDIEGSEVEALLTVFKDFPKYLPFGQMGVEIHAPVFRTMNITIPDWRNQSEKYGLRPFHFSPKLTVLADPKLFVEYSFLNIKSPLFKIVKKVGEKVETENNVTNVSEKV